LSLFETRLIRIGIAPACTIFAAPLSSRAAAWEERERREREE
jgi:hypothetical protein